MKKKCLLGSALLAACFVLTAHTLWAVGLGAGNFKEIATEGITDSANSYAWGTAEFNGDIYVSTNRHHLWGLLQGMGVLFPEALLSAVMPAGPANEEWGNIDWANALRGEIWRYRESEGWTRVHQAALTFGELPIAPNPTLPPPPDPPIEGWYPESYGYRALGVFNGHLYAIGIGPWVPNMPLARILQSNDGDSWQDVSGIIGTATNPRGLVEYDGKLFISASLPGTAPAGAGIGLVYCYDPATSPPQEVEWQQISLPGFGNWSNVEIPYLAVFNDCLYASTVNFNTGFEVWKTDGEKLADGKYKWVQVISDGFGDTHNQWGMTMQAFGDYIYVGTAVGAGMVLKNGQPVGTRAIDVIRIDKDDNAALVVGAYFPQDPPPGWPTVRVPLSRMPAGFGNPLNVYAWHMTVHEGWLLLGTFDMSGIVFKVANQLLQADPTTIMGLLSLLDPDATSFITVFPQLLSYFDFGNVDELVAGLNLLDLLNEQYGGADLWKTKNGIEWEPVTLNGFNNPNNYGIRRLLSVKDDSKHARLYVGTANPFTNEPDGGCEVLVNGSKHKKADLNEDGIVDYSDLSILSDEWLQSSDEE